MNFRSKLLLKLRILADTAYLRLFVKPRKRPDPIDIRAQFNSFVRQYGGEVCDDANSGADLPPIADYVFSKQNVIAELKSLEVDPFDPRGDPGRLFGELTKAGMSSSDIFRWSMGQQPLSEQAKWRLATLFRRGIEKLARKARDQIESTKRTYGMPDALGLLLIANHGNYLFNFPDKQNLISDVMARHFNRSAIHGVVFFSPNVPVRIPGSLREWHPWYPCYQAPTSEDLVAFVNDLGDKWGKYFFALSGESAPDIKIPDPEIAEGWMSGARNIDVRSDDRTGSGH